ncbi:MAG: hypothetical protein IKF07_07635 [Eubacterium sp.]|nr:hypothetical protein [Eubacterium sp.]
MAGDPGEKKKNDNIWYSFSTKELELLLAAAGAKKWYSPAGDRSSRAVSREVVNRLLAGMYRKGILAFDDGRIVMSEEQEKITEIIKDASAVASSVCGVKSGIPYIAYFCRGKAAVLRADIAGRGRVIVKMIDDVDWPGFLLEESQAVYSAAGAGKRKDDDIRRDTDENFSGELNGISCGSRTGTELKISGEGLRRAGTELAGCGDILKRLSSELYTTLSGADKMDHGCVKALDEAQKTLELNGLRSDAMAEVLIRTADEADRAEKMILDHEALMKAAHVRPGESDLADMSETLDKAVRK